MLQGFAPWTGPVDILCRLSKMTIRFWPSQAHQAPQTSVRNKVAPFKGVGFNTTNAAQDDN